VYINEFFVLEYKNRWIKKLLNWVDLVVDATHMCINT